MPVSVLEDFRTYVQHEADIGNSVEALIMRHERQTWELINVLFSEIQAEVGSKRHHPTSSSISFLPNLGRCCHMARIDLELGLPTCFGVALLLHTGNWRGSAGCAYGC